MKNVLNRGNSGGGDGYGEGDTSAITVRSVGAEVGVNGTYVT